jgi:phage protein D
MSLPNNPHAIIEIDYGESVVTWDSWANPRLIKSVNIELTTNESAEARWELFDPKFKVIDNFTGANGVPLSTVRVFLGYGQDLGEPLFKGLLAQIERGEATTSFTAFDMGFKMKLIKKAGYKNKKDDLAILKELATRNGLKFEGPEKPLKLEPHKAIMQDEQTDWEWAMERARDSGLVLFVRQDTLFAKYPAKVGTPVLTLKNKKDFILQRDWDFIFRTPENQDGRPRRVKVRGRTKGGKRIEGQSDDSNRGRENVILKRDVSGKATKSKLTRRAQAQKELDREHAFEAQIAAVFPPNGERLDVRNTVRIENVGKLFSGDYICNTVSYEFEAGSLGMNLDLYRDINV